MLRRECAHICNHRLIHGRQTQLAAQRGPRDPQQHAGESLAQASFASELDLLAIRSRAHREFALIYLSTEMSRSRSASKHLSRLFSNSSAFSRLTSDGIMPPKHLREAKIVG